MKLIRISIDAVSMVTLATRTTTKDVIYLSLLIAHLKAGIMGMTATLQKTSRREARESYVRYLLEQHGVTEGDAEQYLTMPQDALDGKSLIELIYSGSYEKAVSVVERFVEDTDFEEDE